MTDDPHEFDLVMPFTVVKSVGGPFDDESYVAGFELGQLSARLQVAKTITASLVATIRTANVPQADLLAMSEGYHLQSMEPLDGLEEWTMVSFIRPLNDEESNP